MNDATILAAYNRLADIKLNVIAELEQKSKVLFEETICQTTAGAQYRRIYACYLKDIDGMPHVVSFYRLDHAVCDEAGDVVDCIPYEYGMIEPTDGK